MKRSRLVTVGIIVFLTGLVLPVLILSTPWLQQGGSSTGVTVDYSEYSDLLEKITRQARAVSGMPVYAAELSRAGSNIVPLSAGNTGVYYKTNIQVVGVDEEDIVKTNGRLIAIARYNEVILVDASEKRVVSRISSANNTRGIYLVDNKLVVIRGGLYPEVIIAVYPPPPIPDLPTTTVEVYDLEDPYNPKLLWRVNTTCVFTGSRLVDNYLYIVGYLASYEYSYVNEEVNITPVIPLVNNKPIPRGRIIESNDYLSYILILAVDINTGNYTVTAYTGGRVDWIYMVPDRLYVAWSSPSTIIEKTLKELLERLRVKNVLTPSEVDAYMERLDEGLAWQVHEELRELLERHVDIAREISQEPIVVTDETVFLVLDISGLEVSKHGLFTVPGHVLDQFAIEEYRYSNERLLIVATTLSKFTVYVQVVEAVYTAPLSLVKEAGERTTTTIIVSPQEPRGEKQVYVSIDTRSVESINAVYVVNEELSVISRLEGLAPGERIYSARLLKNILYLVTFRQVDPLFAIDLSNPYNPVVLGFLKIPGFSEYLHPIGETLMLGIGLEGSLLKISLFDISDPANMREVAKIKTSYSAWSSVFEDHHAFMIDQRYSLVVIPVSTRSYLSMQEGFMIIEYNTEKPTIDVKSLIPIKTPLRSIYIGNELYLIGASRILIYSLPALEYLGEVSY